MSLHPDVHLTGSSPRKCGSPGLASHVPPEMEYAGWPAVRDHGDDPVKSLHTSGLEATDLPRPGRPERAFTSHETPAPHTHHRHPMPLPVHVSLKRAWTEPGSMHMGNQANSDQT